MKRRLLILVVFAVLLAAEALWLLPDLRAAQSPERPAAPPDTAAQPTPPEPAPPADPMAAMRRLPERPAQPAEAPAGWYAPQAADSGDIERLPPSVLGEAADYSYSPSVSADGRYTAFYSNAGNLVPGDMDGLPDIFVYDRQTGQTEMVSVNNYGYNEYGYFYDPSISDDGRYVAFYGWSYYLTDDYADEWRGDVYVHDRQTGLNTRVSVKSNGAHANGGSYNPELSADGVNVVFESNASNLVTGDTNNASDIFLHNRNTGVTSRVSVKATNTQANDMSFDPSISADGRYVAFYSYATNLVTGDTNGQSDIFVRDVTAKTTTRVSVGGGGAQGNDWSGDPIISDNGRYVAFASGADNLTPDDGDEWSDVFIRDRQANTTTLVSRDAAGNPSDGWAQWPSLSADGSLVAFDDYANLTPGGNGSQNVYVRNWQTGTIVRASVDGSGAPSEGSWNGVLSADGTSVAFDSYSPLLGSDSNGVEDIYLRRLNVNQTLRASGVAFTYTAPNNHSAYPAPSLDGRYVAYASWAGNLVPGDGGGDLDVFVTDRQTDVTTAVSTDAYGYVIGGVLEKVDISDNGRYVAFAGRNSYVEDDTNDRSDIHIRDRQTNTTTLVSVNSDGEQGDLDSWNPSLSGDGNLVAFVSAARNLVANDNNDMVDAFVHNRATGVTTRVSLTAGGGEATWDTGQIDIAAAGRFVVMTTYAALTPDDNNGYDDVYVRDLQTGALELITRAYDGSGTDGNAYNPVISSDGRYVAFESWASNLVADDANGYTTDIFLYDRQIDQMTLVSRSYDAGTVYSGSERPSISHDGRYVGFTSYADNLVADDFNYSEDVFVYDRVNGSIGRASVNAGGEEGNYTSGGAAISGDGSKVAFGSYADNLVPGDTYGFKNVYITDRPIGSTGGDGHNLYFISPSGKGNVGGIAFTGADILRYTRSSNTWQMIYDGSARGTAKNVGAFDLLGDGSLLLVFSANQVIPGLGTATPRDVVLFEPFDPQSYPLGAGTYSWYMRGANSGLTTKTESIDALSWSYNGIDLAPVLTISTTGAAAVGPNGSIKAQDEDALVCTLYNGLCDWQAALALDGSTIPGMAAEDVNGLARGFINGSTYVTIGGAFNVGGVSGNGKSILRLTPAGAGWNVAAIDWLAPGASFPSNLDGLSLTPPYDPYP